MRRPLNEAQQRAATTTDGPLLIIAGPGSGKTHTLVERVLHLITERGVPPEQILVSTFTEKAAAELVTRVSGRLADVGLRIDLSEMFIGTLHSLCLRLLDAHREHTRLQRNYTVLDPFDQQYQIYQSLSAYRKIEGAELILGPPESGGWTQAETLVRGSTSSARSWSRSSACSRTRIRAFPRWGDCMPTIKPGWSERTPSTSPPSRSRRGRSSRTRPYVTRCARRSAT